MNESIKRRMWPDQAPLASVSEITESYNPYTVGCYEGWRRERSNPVLHQNFENGNDPCILKVNGVYYLYFTWRTCNRISLMKSTDRKNWQGPLINFLPQLDLGWEEIVSQPCVIYKDGVFEMWYAAKTLERDAFHPGESRIAHAVSKDGVNWERELEPVFQAELLWEEYSVAYPSVVYDAQNKKYRMWYSAGDYKLPQLMGYAESKDGIHWTRIAQTPVLKKNVNHKWEREAATMGSVIQHGDYFYMVYCGFEHETNSRLGFARSRDGINWEFHPHNPIITGGKQSWWDGDYTGRASLLQEEDGVWRMWYTGHFHDQTNIGVMTCGLPALFPEPQNAGR